MGTIWIKEFTGGLDARRLPETTPPGALLRGRDGHINRGGEFEQRAAFKKVYELPANTFGLSAGKSSLFVFGRHSAPTMPAGVAYQQLQRPSATSTNMKRILSTDLFAGKIYAIAEFVDGSRFHYYNGTRVADWIDGRASETFTVNGGSVTPGVAAAGSLEVLSSATGTNNKVLNVFVNGVGLLTSPVAAGASPTATATALAAAINAAVTSPDYTASALGAVVTISAVETGDQYNGHVISAAVSGAVVIGNFTALSGGSDEALSVFANLTVNGVAVIGEPVLWRDSHAATAQAIAEAINTYGSEPNYSAVADGATVIITADEAGTSYNAYPVVATLQNGFTINPSTGLELAGGSSTSSSAFQAGTFALTVGDKVYSVAGPLLHFSGVADPIGWQTTDTGAGAIDMSNHTSGAETLTGIGEYQNYVAVFGSRVILVWAVDPDPDQNRKFQTLRNTGTDYPETITQFGDQDLFYLDKNGLRSLRARDSSNAAATTDIGVPVDDLLIAKLKALTPGQRVFGLIEPDDGRFWLCFPDEIFVFSHFPGSKIASWTTYQPTYIDDDGNEQTFTIDEPVVFKGKVYIRSGDDIFAYGGIGATLEYDATQPQLWLPYLDAGKPTLSKTFRGVDVACEGVWRVLMAMQPTDINASDEVATVYRTSYNEPDIPGQGSATHFSLRFEGVGAGPKKISSAVIHYDADDEAEEA